MDTSKQYQDYQNKSGVLHIFSNCLFVKGACKGIMFDIQLKKLCSVPNSLCEFAEKFNNCTLKNIFANFDKTEYQLLNEYIVYITQNLMGAILPQSAIKSFTKLNTLYNSPYHFENATVDICNNPVNEILERLLKLENVGVPHIQLQFLQPLQTEYIEIFKYIENSSFHSLRILSKYNNISDEEIFKNFKKIDSIIFYDSPTDNKKTEQNKLLIWYSTAKNCNCQGTVKKEYFSLATSHFALSQYFNTCLYKKIYINSEGNIQNCPYSKPFGNIDNLSVTQIRLLSENSTFTKNWNVTKDKISVCKDCEFRHFCTDCRVFIKGKNDIYSQPKNCKYNPYIAKWEGEIDYISVEDYMQK